MGQRLSRREVVWYGVLLTTAFYFWWERKKKVQLLGQLILTKSDEKNLRLKLEETQKYVQELSRENQDLKVIHASCDHSNEKKKEMNGSHQKALKNSKRAEEIVQLQQQVKALNDTLNLLLIEKQKEIVGLNIQVAEKCAEIDIQKKEIKLLQECHESQRRSLEEKERENKQLQQKTYQKHNYSNSDKSTTTVTNVMELMQDLYPDNKRNDENHVEFKNRVFEKKKEDPHILMTDNQLEEDSIEPPDDDDSDVEEVIWDTGDPKQIYTDSYLFESGGACVGGIWLARDKRSSDQVVIKKIAADTDERPAYVHAIASSEISIFKHLQRHPNIIKFYEAYVIEKGKEYWIVMEYMDSDTLFDIVTNHKYLVTIFPTEPQIAKICSEILKGLSFMHSRYVLHKDIKSENILFNEKGEIKLADFGNSCRLSQHTGKAKEQEAVGTSYWMAPEIIEEKEHDAKADVWSFGIVVHEMLTGLPPFNDTKEGEEVKEFICNNPIPVPWKDESEWSAPLRDFYLRCLIKDPNKRASTEQLLKHTFCNEKVSTAQDVEHLIYILKSNSDVKSDDNDTDLDEEDEEDFGDT